ncbi:uncharacterized protein LOC117339316 isoform X2 [Pecten maximus]|uniref:uncharacterized protein LOC117339316 isoform X2 n=1 Tax=Pecten maximus TaxID=6579 RepID=UPI001458776A|nr:uncharacterized protein LOC117339316 isoform X2 [Pecten maximus]
MRTLLTQRHSTITVRKKNVLLVCFILLLIWTFHSFENEHEIAPSNVDESGIKAIWEFNAIPETFGQVQMVDDSIVMIPERSQLELLALPRLEELYKRNLNNLQIFCPVKTVFGGTHDGWNVCSTEQRKKCVVYLITSNPNPSSFLAELSSIWGCQVFKIEQKDCNENTLRQISDKHKSIDIFAVDVDDSEAILLQRMMSLGVVNRIKQLLVTFHGDMEGNLNAKQYQDRLALQRDLLHQGYRIFHRTRNTQCTHCDKTPRPGCVTLSMMLPSQVKAPLVIPSETYLGNLTSNQLNRFYHRYLLTTQTFCKKLSPMGSHGRGGWEVCADKPYSPTVPCLIYSFGSADDWAFDSAMANHFGCEVHSFDPRYQNTKSNGNGTSDMVPSNNRAGAVIYHSGALWDRNTNIRRPDGQIWTGVTLKTIKKKLRHLNKQLDVLRIDIDSSEWKVLPSLISSGLLRQVKQLLLELHGDVDDGGDQYHQRLLVLRNLHDIGFRSFWALAKPDDRDQFMSTFTKTKVTKIYQLNLINIYVI